MPLRIPPLTMQTSKDNKDLGARSDNKFKNHDLGGELSIPIFTY